MWSHIVDIVWIEELGQLLSGISSLMDKQKWLPTSVKVQ